MEIESLTPGGIFAAMPALCSLLEECVEAGASIGFLWPMADGEAEAFWRSTVSPVTNGTRVLLIARNDSGAIIGTAQLDLATRANGRHRAEVSKLMVAPSSRRAGIARALMIALEEEARKLGRTTLHLDTNEGDGAERLYEGLGWTKIGGIPEYAAAAHNGELKQNAIYYKLLREDAAVSDAHPARETATG